MNAPYRLSVVVPTYRRRESVLRLLHALEGQTLPAEQFEVVVSIDGSEDGTREALAALSTPYRLRILWSPNGGRATACNRGIAAATGEYMLLLDDDMQPEPACLAAHLRAHEESADPLAVMGAIPLVLGPDAPQLTTYINIKFTRLLATLAQPGHTIGFREFSSANLSIRRQLVVDLGCFDESFTEYGNEDGELALRLLDAGVRLRYCPQAIARQHYAKDFAALAADNYSKGRTAVLLASKHPETYPHLRLSAYHQGSRKWRLLRALLLILGRRIPATAHVVLAFVALAERRRWRRLHLYYDLAVDYFFWLGTRTVRDPRRSVS